MINPNPATGSALCTSAFPPSCSRDSRVKVFTT